ncbi:hypothetical protein [Natronorubrum halophilum]|uniref:hypothetical protein n=1 Tax=Natronorubrum halophilum TaxID=1702106 RepID=UPI0010C1F778|nr:hypothetical protein [Natronorubrum halophilum]
MALNKLRQLDQNSAGITLPKDDLRIEGLLDENGDVDGEHQIHVRHIGNGEWTLEIVEEIGI